MNDEPDHDQRNEASASPGSVFGGDFRVIRELRSGGMGQLFTVEQLSTGGVFVLKLLPPDLVDHRPARERFAREAKAMASISSAHSVEVITSGVDDATGTPFIVMELLDGEDLADAIDRCGALPLPEVAQILGEVAEALQDAHAHGIVHRDLKPENIFLVRRADGGEGFNTKLLDFGVAKFITAADAIVGTQPVGSPLFMAPEQADSLGPITAATDVWAFGLLAFLLLTGRHFWLGAETGSVPSLLRESILDPLVPASERATAFHVATTLPSQFDAWFARCVNRDPASRFQSVTEAARAFEEVARDRLLLGEPAERTQPPAPPEPDLHPDEQECCTLRSPPLFPAPPADSAIEQGSGLVESPRAMRSTPSGIVLVDALRPTSGPPPRRGRRWDWRSSAGAVAIAIVSGIAVARLARSPEPTEPVAGSQDAALVPTESARGSGAPAVNRCGPGAVLVEGPSLPAFCMDATEFSVGRYEPLATRMRASKVVRTPSPFDALCNLGRRRLSEPVNCLSADDAAEACAALGGRLPTVAEWHTAERSFAGQVGALGANTCGAECAEWGVQNKVFVDALTERQDEFPGTSPVGAFAPRAGREEVITNLAGNVSEWTSDAIRGVHFICGPSFLSGRASFAEPTCRPDGARVARASVGFRCVYDVATPARAASEEPG